LLLATVAFVLAIAARRPSWLFVGVPVVLLLLVGIRYQYYQSLSQIRLFEDSLEFKHPFGTRIVHRSEMRGYRIIPIGKGVDRVRIELVGDAKSLVMPLFDAPPVLAWLKKHGLSDLNAADVARARSALQQDQRYGDTTKTRRDTLDMFGRASFGSALLGLAILVWTLFLPWGRTVAACVAASTPLLIVGAVVGTGRRMAVLSDSRVDARPGVGWLLIGGIGPGLRAFFDAHLVDPLSAVGPVYVLAAGAYAAFWLVDPRPLRTSIPFWILVGLTVGWAAGALVTVDKLLDHTPPKHFRVPVISTRIVYGKSTGYYIAVAPWGPFPKGQEFRNRRLYERVKAGDELCMTAHDGALRIKWYEAQLCPPATPA
jgi:hypothetical protein